MCKPRYPVEKEYEALRNELLLGKKYVFERPILIITAAFASAQLLKNDIAIYIAPIVIGLLSFNLWFTVNRLGSMARIVAYIQIILEDKEVSWFGWETSLRKYRKWLKIQNLNIRDIEINLESVYDNLGYYPVIFWVHIAANLFTAIFIILYTYIFSWIVWPIAIICILSMGLFTKYAYNHRPIVKIMEIEQNRKIWKDVLDNWNNL